MPGNASNNSFGSGFAAGTRLGDIRIGQERNQLSRQQLGMQQQQNEQDQQNLLRQNFLEGMQQNITDVQKTTASFAPAIKIEKDQGKLDGENTKAYQATVPVMLSDMAEVVKAHIDNGVISEGEGTLIMRRAAMASQLTDPAAQEQLEADIQENMEVSTAEGTLPVEIAKIKERGKQARLTAAVPRHERITNENPDELAPPQIGQIYGIENATVDDLRNQNIYIPDDNKVLRELIPANAAYKGLTTSGTTALELLKQNPDVAAIGGLAEFGENIKAQATALARQIGFDVDEVDLASPEVQTEIEKLAGANRELQGVMVSMAYASAISKGQTGQGLSDKDVANEVKQIGGDARTPEGMQRAIMAFMERTEGEYRSRIQNTLNQPPPKSAYSMNADELVQMIEQAGGFESLPQQDQMVVRARVKFLEQGDQ